MKKLVTWAVLLWMAVMLLASGAAAAEPAYAVSEIYAQTPYYARLATVELTGDWHTDIVNVALSQIGYHESDTPGDNCGSSAQGYGNCTEYGNVYGGLNAQWCAMFVSWCARQANIPRYVINTSARAYPDGVGGDRQYAFHINSVSASRHAPRVGDLVFFSSTGYGTDHVGLVARTTETGIYTVEGNSLNAVRMNYYDYDSDYISRYGVYDIYTEPTAQPDTVETTRLTFACADGWRGTHPDEPDEQYTFRALLAVHGRELQIPPAAFAREDSILLGYHVQNLDNGTWLGSDSKWYSAVEIEAGNAPELYLVPDGVGIDVNGFWTEAAELRLYCVWEQAGETVSDSAETSLVTKDESGWLNPYADVARSAWYYSAVRTCAAKKLLPETVLLAPDEVIAREHFAELLWRGNGAPKTPAEELHFTDVDAENPRREAIAWVWKQGLMSGVSETEFGPQGVLTREQAAAIFWRLADKQLADQTAVFEDAEEISDWATAAMNWATEAGVMHGVPGEDGISRYAQPKAELSLAQALAMITRAGLKN